MPGNLIRPTVLLPYVPEVSLCIRRGGTVRRRQRADPALVCEVVKLETAAENYHIKGHGHRQQGRRQSEVVMDSLEQKQQQHTAEQAGQAEPDIAGHRHKRVPLVLQ